jgi:phosphatidylglycerol---prolipoprotein diacylglyceryl transferase
MFVIPYPGIDPVLVSIGPFAVRWYALAYIVGLVVGWRYCNALARRWAARGTPVASARDIDDFLVWATIGVVLGGRIGYVLFYNGAYYLQHPAQAIELWHGGMSFHGGAAGVCVAIVLFCRRRHLLLLRFADLIACAVPIGLFLGRLANFINGELWGRPGDVPWAMVFPTGGPVPRHPSQLYEATLEGLVLFLILLLMQRSDAVRGRPGTVTGVFLIGYGAFRIVAEFFREPDQQLGFLVGGATMGQLLSLPLIVAGSLLIWYARRRAVAPS